MRICSDGDDLSAKFSIAPYYGSTWIGFSKTIMKMCIRDRSKTVVLREGKKWSISTEKLVLDDLIFLKTGDQVPADVKVLAVSYTHLFL